jgi:hypothetical protein
MIKITSFIVCCFLVLITNISTAQTWQGGGNCNVTVTALSVNDPDYGNSCNNDCNGDAAHPCEHCKTYILYNGSGCTIDNFCVKATGANTPCFSICGITGASGPPCDAGCNNNVNPKCFGGCPFPPGTVGLLPGASAKFTICWNNPNSTTESFQMYWPCQGCAVNCCYNGTNNNFWTDTF